MWVLNLIVGSRKGRLVAIVLAAILISFTAIQLWERGIREQVLQEIEVEQLRQEIDTRSRIDEAVRTSPRDRRDAVDWLRERQSGK